VELLLRLDWDCLLAGALKWLYPSCAVQGCVDQISLETDHRIDWAKTHFTAFDLLDRLCRFHHRLKTTEGWALVEGRGKRVFRAARGSPPPPAPTTSGLVAAALER
jgi:hypothetical protein